MEKVKKIFKHLLTAISVASCISIIFAFITSKLLGLGGSGDYIVMIATIFVFFISIIFYFIYVSSKSLQKLKWFFRGLVALFVVVIIYSVIINFDIDIYLTNLFNSPHLPKQYNEYQDIEQPGLKFKNKEMKLLVGNCYSYGYIDPQNNLIAGPVSCGLTDTTTTKEDQKTYYKFDSRGDILTKFSTSCAYEYLSEGYLINKDEEYYRLWAFDGDTLKRKMKIYNENFSLDAIKQNAFMVDIKKKYSFFLLAPCLKGMESNEIFRRIIFLKDNKWNAFYYDAKTYLSTGDEEMERSAYTRNSHKLNSERNYTKNIQHQYLQKIKLERYNHEYESWNGYYKKWSGCLYTNIIVDKDTLKVKEFVSIERRDAIKDLSRKNPKGSYYLYYSNPKLQYQLVRALSGKLYIIKDKPKIHKKP